MFKRILVLLLLAGPVYALPDAPAAKIHRFYDRPAKVTLFSETLLAGADAGQTCHHLGRTWHERNLPTQSCSGMVGLTVSFMAAGEGLSFLLHKTGHHKLERIPRFYLMYGNIRGLAGSQW